MLSVISECQENIVEGIMALTALYEAETWNMEAAERRRLDYVGKMRCVTSTFGVTGMDRVRNEELRNILTAFLLNPLSTYH